MPLNKETKPINLYLTRYFGSTDKIFHVIPSLQTFALGNSISKNGNFLSGASTIRTIFQTDNAHGFHEKKKTNFAIRKTSKVLDLKNKIKQINKQQKHPLPNKTKQKTTESREWNYPFYLAWHLSLFLPRTQGIEI